MPSSASPAAALINNVQIQYFATRSAEATWTASHRVIVVVMDTVRRILCVGATKPRAITATTITNASPSSVIPILLDFRGTNVKILKRTSNLS